jgi:hypothetical protein
MPGLGVRVSYLNSSEERADAAKNKLLADRLRKLGVDPDLL